MTLRPIALEHFADVLRLNDESVALLSPLSRAQLAELRHQSEFHRVVDQGGSILGFVLALRQGAIYASENYRWFDARYPNFLYVDRVVISKDAQAAGIGSMLYRQLFAHARANGIPAVACEFDIQPPNPGSAHFHRKFGFGEVGQQRVQNGKKLVSLQIARLDLAEPATAGAASGST